MVGQTRRGAAPLLRTVGGKAHATQKDHHDKLKQYQSALPTPPSSNRTSNAESQTKRDASEEDIFADPISSEDDRPSFKQAASAPAAPASPASKSGFKHLQLDGQGEPVPAAPRGFKIPGGQSATSTSSKRKSDDDDSDGLGSDDDQGIFSSSQPTRKRPKTFVAAPGRKNLSNIHAPGGANQPLRRSNPTAQYGREAAKKRSWKDEEKAKGHRKLAEAKEDEERRRAEKPLFRRPKAQTYTTAPEEGKRAGFKAAPQTKTKQAAADAIEGLSSPSLSSLSDLPSSPDLEEIQDLNLPAPKAYAPQALKTECTMCHEQVDFILHERFVDEFNKGRTLNYQWQQRFCRWHKQHSAKETWRERGYPEIDWRKLKERMLEQRHMDHVNKILYGESDSTYRKQLEETVRKGGAKTTIQAFKVDETEDKRGSGIRKGTVGYYGPRGERLMYISSLQMSLARCCLLTGPQARPHPRPLHRQTPRTRAERQAHCICWCVWRCGWIHASRTRTRACHLPGVRRLGTEKWTRSNVRAG